MSSSLDLDICLIVKWERGEEGEGDGNERRGALNHKRVILFLHPSFMLLAECSNSFVASEHLNFYNFCECSAKIDSGIIAKLYGQDCDETGL